MDAIAFIKTAEASKAMVEIALTKDFPFVAQATWWLFNRKNNDWKDFDLAGQMKASGLYDPDTVKLIATISPEPPPGPSKLPPIPEIKQMAGDVERGHAAVQICYTCHHIGNQGGELGPDLTYFGRTQPAEVILDSIINPSADIALGYDASHLVAADGTIIDGIVIQSGDPVIIEISYDAPRRIVSPIFNASISDQNYLMVIDVSTDVKGSTLPDLTGTGKLTLKIDRLDLRAETYHISVGVYQKEWTHAYDYHWQAYKFAIRTGPRQAGLLHVPHRWTLDVDGK